MAIKISNQQHENIIEFIGGCYNAAINPPYDIEVKVLTKGFNVYHGYYLGLNEYQITGYLPDDEEIIAWKHI